MYSRPLISEQRQELGHSVIWVHLEERERVLGAVDQSVHNKKSIKRECESVQLHNKDPSNNNWCAIILHMGTNDS